MNLPPRSGCSFSSAEAVEQWLASPVAFTGDDFRDQRKLQRRFNRSVENGADGHHKMSALSGGFAPREVSLWRARRRSAVHQASAVLHCGRLARAPGPCLRATAAAEVHG
jgi:hypothetical protein